MLRARGLGPREEEETGSAATGERKMHVTRVWSPPVELKTIGRAFPLGAACVGGVTRLKWAVLP